MLPICHYYGNHKFVLQMQIIFLCSVIIEAWGLLQVRMKGISVIIVVNIAMIMQLPKT